MPRFRRRAQRSTLMSILGIVSVVAFAGCASAPGTTSPGGDSKEGPVIGLVVQNAQFFFQGIQDEIETLASASGGQVIVTNINDDSAQLAQAMQTYAQRDVDVVLVPALSGDSDTTAVKSTVDAGIPVVCYNQCIGDASEDIVSAFIRSDGRSLGATTGEAAAEYVESKLGGTASIALLNCDIYVECQLRKAGFKEALEGLEITYVADQEGFLADKAVGVAQDILTAHPDVDIIWAVNEGGTVGARSAIAASDNVGKTVVFGTDISPQITEFLTADDGILLATTGQDTKAIAKAAYDAGLAAIGGEKSDPFDVLVPGVLFTPDRPE
ncbi:substrate-binding domain-containing protein [Microbacterium sp. CIAB417]|uniref:substrate-binding domain-containing protein n=1 Tax=Microbacterium sp. CIAB417 TaxID=2860287 RepID=UPI001FAD7E6D|nr:substrate-binding domain-containing protein [Microbacterium sp. CIAB417]